MVLLYHGSEILNEILLRTVVMVLRTGVGTGDVL